MKETLHRPDDVGVNRPNDFGTDANFLVWRACGWAGVVFLAGFIVFWALLGKFFPPPAQYWSAEQVASFYLQHSVQIRAGMVGAAFFAPFYMLFSALLSRIIRFIEGRSGLLSTIEMMGGIATTMVILLFSVVWMTASVRTGSRLPQDIQLLQDLGWFIFDMTFMVTFFQMIAFGTAVLTDKRSTPVFPRWLGWLSYVACAVFLPELVMPFVLNGPLAWHGVINYYVALPPFFVWMMVCCYYVFKAIHRIERESES